MSGGVPTSAAPLPLHMLYPTGRLGNGLSGLTMVSPPGRGNDEIGKPDSDLATSASCTSEYLLQLGVKFEPPLVSGDGFWLWGFDLNQ